MGDRNCSNRSNCSCCNSTGIFYGKRGHIRTVSFRNENDSAHRKQYPVHQVSGSPTIKPTIAVTIPPTGVFVKVSYIGSFSGAYGTNGAMVNVKNSGDRLYEVVNATGNITASFSKLDGSTKHDITVELWKNGKSLTSAQ